MNPSIMPFFTEARVGSPAPGFHREPSHLVAVPTVHDIPPKCMGDEFRACSEVVVPVLP